MKRSAGCVRFIPIILSLIFFVSVSAADIVWVPIPAGEFEMGCSPSDLNCGGNEFPSHHVSLPYFEMTQTPITQEQYQAVTGVNPSVHTGCPTCPVDSVTWFLAWDFCAEVGERLPSEAEWEYAARAGSSTRYYCGDDPTCLDAIAWYSGTAGGLTHPVGLLGDNDFGLYDMLGNVWEMVGDWYDSTYYASSPAEDPPGPEVGDYKVWRGGAYNSGATDLRASRRISWGPSFTSSAEGFRCARDAAPTTTTTTTTTTTEPTTTTTAPTSTTTTTTTIPADDDTDDDSADDTGDDTFTDDTGDDSADDTVADDDTIDDDTVADDTAGDDTAAPQDDDSSDATDDADDDDGGSTGCAC
jgi:formylglycine-generating enzyme